MASFEGPSWSLPVILMAVLGALGIFGECCVRVNRAEADARARAAEAQGRVVEACLYNGHDSFYCAALVERMRAAR